MTPRLIVSQTECAYGLRPGALRSDERGSRTLQQARRVAAYLAYERCPASYAEIGAALSRTKQDVAQIIERACERMRRDGELAEAIARVEASLGDAAADDAQLREHG